jgi:hypothetical protein
MATACTAANCSRFIAPKHKSKKLRSVSGFLFGITGRDLRDSGCAWRETMKICSSRTSS